MLFRALLTATFALGTSATMLQAQETAVAPAADAPAVETPEAAPAQPRIACEQPEFDFGEIDNNQVVEHTFVVRNDGDGVLEIARVRPACGCTVASISSQRLEPGQTADITSRLSLQGRVGVQHKTIAVESNDPNNPVFTLTMKGTALTEVVVNPQRIFVNDLMPDTPTEHRIDILSNASAPMTLRSASAGNPLLTTDIEVVEEGRRYAVIVRTPTNLPRGATYGRVLIETDNAKMPSIQVPFQFNVVGELAVAPEELAMVEQPESPISRNIVVRPGTVKEFKMLSAEAPLPDMEIVTREMGENGYMLQINNIRPTMDLNGTSITIKTDVPGLETIQVPFRVVPRPNPAP